MVSRRAFLQAVPMGALSLAAAGTPLALGAAPAPAPAEKPLQADKIVALVGDDVPTRSIWLPHRLDEAIAGDTEVGDIYLQEGAVGKLEKRFAELLGKEDAAFMPTGTMANQIAVRILCGDRRHLLLQKESHVYRDEEDATPVLSGINPVPIEGGTGEQLVASIEAAYNQRSEDPYPLEVGAISLESPVRRLDGSTIALDTILRIAAIAKKNGSGMHLDGARLLLMSGMQGFDPKAYAAPFDTVYVSLYKYLGAPFGAILAGDKAHIDRARHVRHIFGGTIFRGWPSAVLTLRGLDHFGERFARVRTAGEALLVKLASMPGIRIERVERGSNIAVAVLDPNVADGLRERARAADIVVGKPDSGRLHLTFNETLLRKPTATIAQVFAT
ncbi:threonine aldolase family protein [Luteibacter aegosomaticola]|uniref:threonine aldolase family protein n=1 Tax=Luteibacter aegosomaticola TaxID=2911538 RepID=UPI001FF8E5FF|nr:beta-eliminating lyase-related protein [Luteibacter aegosomaticola]UPG91654.1 threonine aldolase family protein [Luteibacter aegosomaticola]